MQHVLGGILIAIGFVLAKSASGNQVPLSSHHDTDSMTAEHFHSGLGEITAVIRLGFLAILLVLGGCGVYPKDIALTQSSGDGVIIMKMSSSPDETYRLHIASFDARDMTITGSNITASLTGGRYELSAGKTAVPQFIAKTIPSGTYVFYYFSKQTRWSVCFHAATSYFTIRPGQLLYLGEFDPKPHIAELSRNVLRFGDSRIRGEGYRDYFENISPPHISPPDGSEASMAEARDFVASEMPKVKVAIQPVHYTPTKFGTGYTLLALKTCGGYIREDAKKQKSDSQSTWSPN